MDYKTGDLARLLGVTTNTIRRYESNGYVLPRRDETGYRQYRENDLFKAAIIRLYRRYGFSHDEIEEMMDGRPEKTIDIFKYRLLNTVEEIKRLEDIKEWLVENIGTMEERSSGGEVFSLRKCRGFKYVFFSDGNVFLREEDRLRVINSFMYRSPCVYMIQLWKLNDVKLGRLIPPHNGWAVYERDMSSIGDEVCRSPYVLEYAERKCLFGIMKKNPKNFDPTDKHARIADDFFKAAFAYMREKGLKAAGDPMGIVENSLSCDAGVHIYIPVEEN